MRKIFILIVLSILANGCVDGGQCFTSSVKIINNSGKDIEVFSYRKEYVNGSNILTAIFSKKTILKNNENIYKSAKSCPPSITTNIGFDSVFEGDSIVIDYGDRVSRYGSDLQIYKDKDLRNPFYLWSINQVNRDFIYMLTREDYVNAILK